MTLRTILSLLLLSALLLSACGASPAATLAPLASQPAAQPSAQAPAESLPPEQPTPTPEASATLEPTAAPQPTPLPADLAGPLGETYQRLLLLSALNRAAADLAAQANSASRLDGLGMLLTYTNTLVTQTPFEPLASQWQSMLELSETVSVLLAGADSLDQIQGDLIELADRSEAVLAQAEIALGEQYGIGADYFASQRTLAQPEIDQLRAAFGL